MRKISIGFVIICASLIFTPCHGAASGQKEVGDPLPSWNHASTKQAIINYVKSVTIPGTKDYIPEEDRIATFDNDGTLWAEKPLVQIEFIFWQAYNLLKEYPELASEQPFKALVEKDEKYLKNMGRDDLATLMNSSQSGKTSTEFATEAKDFFSRFRYPVRLCPLTEIRYQPQLELIEYLNDNGFKVFICSGGSVDLMRVISKDYYGIDPERVIGSAYKYEYQDNCEINDLIITIEPTTFNDKEAKPANILAHVGKRPVFACGNVGGAGDVAMLRYSQGSEYPSLQLLVLHDDPEREAEYYEDPDISLTAAKSHGWIVISMKSDWKAVWAE